MFRKTQSQSSLLDAGNYISDALPKTDWSFTFREKIFPLIDENKFKHLYYDKEGRPNASIKVMVSLLSLFFEQFHSLLGIALCQRRSIRFGNRRILLCHGNAKGHKSSSPSRALPAFGQEPGQFQSCCSHLPMFFQTDSGLCQ